MYIPGKLSHGMRNVCERGTAVYGACDHWPQLLCAKLFNYGISFLFVSDIFAYGTDGCLKSLSN